MSPAYPDGPRGIPLLGPVLELAANPLAFLEKTAKNYGDISSFLEGPTRRVILLNHPDHIEALLVRHARDVIKDRITRKLRRAIGDGLVTSEGAHWKRQRRLTAPSFTPHQIAHYGDQMVRRTADAIETWESGEERDIHRDMMAITLNIVVDTLFGEAADSDVADAVGHALDVVTTEFDIDVHSWRLLLPEWAPTAGRRRMNAAVRVLDDVLGDIIRAGRDRSEGPDCLLGRLLAARDEDNGQGMSDTELRDELMTVFVAGHETTGLALFYALLLLGNHPDAARRMREEVDAALDSRLATVDDLPKLPYTRAIVNEAMRVYPPVWIIGREVVAPFEFAGVEFQPGNQVLASQWVVHHDARWFPEPEVFRPERWLEEHHIPRFAFFPFGGGPRVCVGNHFAMMELVLVMATLAQRVQLTPLESGMPDLVTSVTLRPNSHTKMKVQLRDATAVRD
jgi:cytochrome P450